MRFRGVIAHHIAMTVKMISPYSAPPQLQLVNFEVVSNPKAGFKMYKRLIFVKSNAGRPRLPPTATLHACMFKAIRPIKVVTVLLHSTRNGHDRVCRLHGEFEFHFTTGMPLATAA